jgi:tetratricopeptide (TPR) repeat protein
MRYRRVGDPKDLDAVLHNAQEIVNLTSVGHSFRDHPVRNIAASFSQRYEMKGNLKDLKEAVRYRQKAVELIPKSHPDCAWYLADLAVSLESQYVRLGKPKDVGEALRLRQEVIDMKPKGDPGQAEELTCLRDLFNDQFVRFGNMRDLNTESQIGQEALALIPGGILTEATSAKVSEQHSYSDAAGHKTFRTWGQHCEILRKLLISRRKTILTEQTCPKASQWFQPFDIRNWEISKPADSIPSSLGCC